MKKKNLKVNLVETLPEKCKTREERERQKLKVRLFKINLILLNCWLFSSRGTSLAKRAPQRARHVHADPFYLNRFGPGTGFHSPGSDARALPTLWPVSLRGIKKQ